MKFKISYLFLWMIFITLLSCKTKSTITIKSEKYVPVDKELYETIVELDNKFFNAYNKCDLKTQELMISNDVEFFHDKGGLSTSKEEIMTAMKNNICGKVTRTLVAGSIEVYPIKDYGAVQIGYHKFKNNQEPDAISKKNKFITIWKNENKNWRMTRIISLH